MSIEDTTGALVGVLPLALVAGLAYKMSDKLFPKPGLGVGARTWQDEFLDAYVGADNKKEERLVLRSWEKQLVGLGVAHNVLEARRVLKQVVATISAGKR